MSRTFFAVSDRNHYGYLWLNRLVDWLLLLHRVDFLRRCNAGVDRNAADQERRAQTVQGELPFYQSLSNTLRIFCALKKAEYFSRHFFIIKLIFTY